MKTLTEKQSFLTRLANGDNKAQLAAFAITAAVLIACVIAFGHTFKFGL